MAKNKSPMDREAEGPELKKKPAPEADENGQLSLLDVEHEANKPILKLARAIKSLDKERSEAQGKADEKRHELAELMRSHKVRHFRHSGFEVTLKDVEKVSVKAAESSGESGDAD